LRKVYLDHSATTPTRAEVAEVVLKYMVDKFGNPSSIHAFGREASQAMEKAREQVAKAINALTEEIVFTSGGTEGDNLAVIGTALQYASRGRHVITSAVEHHAVLDSFDHLAKQGFKVSVLPVDGYGLVSADELRKAITPDTILISVMHANNEVGTIEPVEELGRIAKEHGVLFHVDAVQSLGKIPVDVQKIKADLLTGSGHKIYGPKGTGFLFIRKGVELHPLFYGGGQEKKIRPGTENLPGIVGLGLAVEMAIKEMEEEMPRLAKLRDHLIDGLRERVPHVRLNGHPQKRIPINVNMSFDFVEGESLLTSFDMKGIAASGASACSAGDTGPSHVLTAMGLEPDLAKGSVRMTLGKDNTEEDIRYLLAEIPAIVERLRKSTPHFDREKKECAECALKR